MVWRRYTTTLGCAVLALALGIAGFNFAVDPLFQYRHPARFGGGYYPQDRLLMAGLARHLDYEAVLIGTSYSQNFRPSQLGAALHVAIANLAVAGATAFEQRLVLAVALERDPMRRVLWEVTPGAYGGAPEGMNEAAYFPRYLYEPGILTPVRYLLSAQTVEIAIDVMKGKYPSDLERYNHWNQRYPAGRARMIADWCRRGLRAVTPGSPVSDQEMAQARTSLEHNFAAVVRAHPHVRFDAFLPPFSFAAYHLQPAEGVFALRATLVAYAREFANLRVHDFQIERRIVLDLERYKDETHFDAEVNAWMAHAIAAESHLLVAENLDARDAELRAIMATPLDFDCD